MRCFALGWTLFGHFVQYILRLVDPAPLSARFTKQLLQGFPESHGTVTNCQFGLIHSPAFQVHK